MALFPSSLRRVALLAFLFLPACSDDEGAAASIHGQLAVGAYRAIQLRDACVGWSKVPGPCTTEHLVEVLAVTVEDPAIVRVVDRDEAPGSWGTLPLPILQGRAPGKTKVVLTGAFDDGSERTAEVDITVREVRRVVITSPCQEEPFVVPVGERIELGVRLEDEQGNELVGSLPDFVTGEGLVLTLQDGNNRLMFAPQEAGRWMLTSPFDTALARELQGAFPSEVTGYRWSNHENVWQVMGAFLELQLQALVESTPVCQHFPLEVEALTPEVCANARFYQPFAATHETLRIEAVSSGRCTVSLSPEGASSTFELSRDLLVTGELPTPTHGTPCDVMNQQACVSSLAVYQCTGGTWQERRPCSSQEMCRIRPQGIDNCQAEGGWCARCVPQ